MPSGLDTTRVFLTADMVSNLSQQHVLLSIALMMVLAIVLCLCSEADAFVAASFVTLRPAAKLAFLVLGPMIDFKLYLMYTQVFRPRLDLDHLRRRRGPGVCLQLRDAPGLGGQRPELDHARDDPVGAPGRIRS